MPEISRFFGIVIAIYYNDHEPAHFHARYGESEARIDIMTGATLSGALPPCAMRLVLEWTALHRRELLADWARARMREPLERIDPLE